MKEFKKELRDLINTHSIDTVCNISDTLLAELIVGAIKGIKKTKRKCFGCHECDPKQPTCTHIERS